MTVHWGAIRYVPNVVASAPSKHFELTILIPDTGSTKLKVVGIKVGIMC
jgi:hypothetical protein